jgi:tetrahydromethanopterin S-methyltransferase subunit A
MSGPFLVPVEDDWIERFERTVEQLVRINPEDAPEPLQDLEEARISGTTDEGRKRALLEQIRVSGGHR